MSFTIHTSNRMEVLLGHLADVLDHPVGPVLAQETIVVQSRGMERWISMELARRRGIWGNCSFPFPNKYVRDIFARTMNDIDDSSAFDVDTLAWRIIARLGGVLENREFGELATYLEGHGSGLKQYQLAEKIADTFDQYTLYRGDVLKSWESGSAGGWQALLWKALTDGENGWHRARVKTEFLARLRDGRIDTSLLPRRILLFGLSYIPAFHMEVLTGIASFADVHIFALSPCKEFWGDIISRKSRSRYGSDASKLSDEGNALLASLGALGRSFCNMIQDSVDTIGEVQDDYVESRGCSLLSSLQNSILNLAGTEPGPKIDVASGDRSIDLHSCHSPMREVEVLHDQLLEMFSTMDGLTPRDIIVMTPDIETYSPYISAVFSGNQDHGCRIPFTIADRSMRKEGRVGETLMAILALQGGRFTAPEVVDILASGPVSRCFGMSLGDIDLVKKWLEHTCVRWGMNAHDREALGLPGYSEGSWLAGIERLVLGYAMSSDGSMLCDGILPYDNMEGDAAKTLGEFVSYVRSLHATATDLGRSRSLAQWCETLGRIQKSFLKAPGESEREYRSVEIIIASLEQIEEQSGYHDMVGLDVIRSWLAKKLDNEGAGTGFLSGRVTFCAMLPMRSIPARVIALLGMNDGSFPRQSRPPSFDIIPVDRRPGDRSLRDEDRYLFLESLLSARERFYISYTGLSIRDNSEIPPSVLVSELLDFLDQNYSRGGEDFSGSALTQHRLQPFSPAYFDGTGKLFSYSVQNLLAARGGLEGGGVVSPFFSIQLSPPDELYREVRISDLMKFFENPSSYILRHRLGIKPEESISPLEEREIFALDDFGAYKIKQQMLDYALSGKDPIELYPLVRAGGVLPPAGRGDDIFNSLVGENGVLAARVLSLIGGDVFLPALDVDIIVGGFRIYGRIDKVLPELLLRYRCARLSAKDQVKLWIEHLILNIASSGAYPKRSRLLMFGGEIALKPVADCAGQLELLLNRYWQGLMSPLRFFPRSSMAYAVKGTVKAAVGEWNNKKFPESGDAAYKLCFSNVSPFDQEFMETSTDVFAGYLEHLEEASC